MANVGTYDNILPTGLSNLVIQNITGAPTGYNVYDGNGVLVASGSWPSVTTPAFVGGSDNSVSATGTGSLSLTPSTSGGATPAVGTTLVVMVSTDGPGASNNLTISGGHATWTNPLPASGQNNPAVFVGTVTTAGAAAITVTGNTGQNLKGVVSAWANVSNYGPVDQTGTNATISGTSPAIGPTLTTVGNGEVIFAIVDGQGTVGTPTALITEFSAASGLKSGGSGDNMSAGYYLQTSAGALSTWGWSMTGGAGYAHVAAVSLSPAVGGTTLSIPAPSGTWAPGYYYVDFIAGGVSVDSVQVAVFRDLGKLPSPTALPVVGSDPAIGTPAPEGEDLYLHGWLAHGPERYAITTTASPTVDTPGVGGLGRTIAGITTGVAAEVSTGLYFAPSQADSARPRVPVVYFPDDYTTTVGGAVSPATYEAGVAAAVTALGPGTTPNITYFEGKNEPDEAGLSDAQAATLYNQFRTGLRTGSTSAKALGPAYSGGSPNSSGFSPQLSQFTTFINDVVSGGGTLDALSYHGYNALWSEPLATEASIGGLRAVLVAAGLGTIPIFVTEMGNAIKNFYNGAGWAFITDHRIVSQTAHLYLSLERYGVPKEHVVYFYDTYLGGQEVYTCLKSTDGSLGPQAVFFRVYSEELWGKAWLRSIVPSGVPQSLYRAEVFDEGSSGSGTGACVAIYAKGTVSDTATLSNVGSGTVTVSDWLGNTSTYSPSGGSITIPIGDIPVYVRIPHAQASSVAITSIGGGINTGTNLAPSATAKAGSNPASLTTTALLNNGVFETGGYLQNNTGQDTYYQSTTVPHYAELDWGAAQTFDHVTVVQAPPYMDNPSNSTPASAMLTGKLEYWNGTTWVGCPTVGQNHWDTAGNYNNTTGTDFLTTIGHDASGPSTAVFSQWDQNWVNNVVFSTAVTASKLRLTVSSVSRANFVNSTTMPWGSVGSAVSLSEILVYHLASAPSPATFDGYAIQPYAGVAYSGSSETPQTLTGTASFVATAAMNSVGGISIPGTAHFTGTAALTATSYFTLPGTAGFVASASITSSGSVTTTLSGSALFSGSAALITTGSIVSHVSGTASFTASASITTTAAVITPVAPSAIGEPDCIFRTPGVQDEAPYLPDSPAHHVKLYRHFENRWRGVNVWQRSDGSFVQDTPTNNEAAQTAPAAFFSDDPVGPYEIIGQTDTNVNYPWNPFPGAGPESPSNPGQYVYGTNWDQTTFTEQLDPYMTTWFQPGATIEITHAEALVLTAAGYGDCIS